MSKINDGGPAFPVVLQSQTDNGVTYYERLDGMTLRDHFAGLVMPALLARITDFPDDSRRCGIALDAYAMADAMIWARTALASARGEG